jgi:hypothetical protein
MMKDTKLDGQPFCPACGETVDGALDMESDKTPGDGDIGVCMYCGEFMVYRAEPNGQFRIDSLSAEQFHQMPFNTKATMLKYRSAIEQMRRDYEQEPS